MDIVVKIAQFFCCFSILVLFHEFGHFIFAKMFKTRVEKFYMFFDPWFSLFKFKKGETEYGMGWVPFGGYVKISGMIDESMDTEQMKQPPQPWEFRSKPAWQRLLIMLGGVMVNILLAFVIYIGVLYAWGETYLPAKNAKYGVVCDSVFINMGMRNGDIIYALDYKEVERFDDIVRNILLDDPRTIQVMRGGESVDLTIPDTLVAHLLEMSSKKFGMKALLVPRVPLDGIVIKGFAEKSVAYEAGMRKGDRLLKIDSTAFHFSDEFRELLSSGRGRQIETEVLRGIDTLRFAFNLGNDGMLGIEYEMTPGDFEFAVQKYTFFKAIPAGIQMGVDEIGNYLKQFKMLFQHKEQAYKSLAGVITIGSIFPGEWDWQIFWRLTALISIMLAVVNILPIPALDGGHVLFLLYEVITRQKPGEKFMMYAQTVGMMLILGLIILATVNDISKFF